MGRKGRPQLNETFELLSNPRRRYVLYHLMAESECVDPDDLAERIANWEANDTSDDGDDNLQTVKTALQHIHLPRLADAGVITYESNPGTIEFDGTDEFAPFLEVAARLDGYDPVAADD
ncbi:DUF7344 domain-containing protein [Haladaptatus sp. NG-SE-30]